MNDFNEWLRANGFDPETIGANMKSKLQATWRMETGAAALTAVPATPAPVAASPPPPPAAPAPSAQSSYDEKVKAIEDENARQEYIRAATLRAMEANVGNPEKTKQLRELGEHALADKKVTTQAFDLSLLRADRFSGPLVMSTTSPQATEEVIEAAICVSQRLAGVETKFSDQVLQAAHSKFRRGIGLQELLALAAEKNSGYRGSHRDVGALCRAAFRPRHAAEFGLMSAGGPSTISVPGLLSNVANKFLAAGFLYTEQTWRLVAKIRPGNDYKEMTTYRLTGNNTFEKVAASGEIKHGTLSELTYGNRIDIFGKMIGISEKDIRNDDLGAFTGASDELGRGAGDSLNNLFWAEWLDDAAFFNTDKSKANYDDGATDSVLSLAGLDNAETILRKQTKPDGTPLGAMPAVLLTPASLANTAQALMGSQGLVVGTTPASGPATNVFYGRYRPASSVYLDAASATAWYLLVDPNTCRALHVPYTYTLGAGYESDSGDSGGGVFVAGELVGVHCGKCGPSAEATRTPYAASARPIRSLLSRVLKRNGSRVEPVAVAPATVKPAPIQAPTTSYYYPSLGGCSNGSCPAPTYRRGIFR